MEILIIALVCFIIYCSYKAVQGFKKNHDIVGIYNENVINVDSKLKTAGFNSTSHYDMYTPIQTIKGIESVKCLTMSVDSNRKQIAFAFLDSQKINFFDFQDIIGCEVEKRGISDDGQYVEQVILLLKLRKADMSEWRLLLNKKKVSVHSQEYNLYIKFANDVVKAISDICKENQ